MSNQSREKAGAKGGNRKRRFTVDSLFTDTTPGAVGVEDLPNAKEIRLDRIVPDPNQPRHHFDDERLQELAESIRREGVLQPIAVRYERDTDEYVILHGERRWRAAQQAALRSIPAVVRDIPEERRLVQQLMENVVREDLNAVDRAAALRVLKSQMNDAPWEQVAEAVGIRRSRLFQLLGTEKLPDEVQVQIRTGELSEKQSRVLQGLPALVQESLAAMLIRDDLSQSQAQRLARAVRDDPSLAELDRDGVEKRINEFRSSISAPTRSASNRERSLNDAVQTLFPDANIEEVVSNAQPVAQAEFQRTVQALASTALALQQGGLSAVERKRTRQQLAALRTVIDRALAAK